MAMTMKEKASASHVKTEWPAALKAEFAREAEKPNGCVGSELLSETEKLRVWTIRLKPGERIGFHRHVLNYFWTSVNGGRGRQHLMDGTTIEYTYTPGETRQRIILRKRPRMPALPSVSASTTIAARKGPKLAMGLGNSPSA